MAYLVLVALALLGTLASLERDGFDGLNNLAQLVLGLPWTVTPRGANHATNAYIDAACGAFNALLLFLVVCRVERPGSSVN